MFVVLQRAHVEILLLHFYMTTRSISSMKGKYKLNIIIIQGSSIVVILLQPQTKVLLLLMFLLRPLILVSLLLMNLLIFLIFYMLCSWKDI